MGFFLAFFLVFAFSFSSFASTNLEFKPEKERYKKGEKICFTLVNNTDKTIFLPSSAPWAVFKEDKEKGEKVIFSPISSQTIVKIKPGEKKKWCWKQKTYKKDEEILSGDYKVRITVFENGQRQFLSFKVKIVPDYADAK